MFGNNNFLHIGEPIVLPPAVILTNDFSIKPETNVGDHSQNRPIQIFVVSDYRLLHYAFALLAQENPRRVSLAGTATDCDLAWDYVTHAPVDVLVVDAEVVAGDWLALVRRASSERQIKCLLMARQMDPQTLDQAVMQGARGLLDKDADRNGMLSAIEKVNARELWLNRETTGRIFVALSRHSEAPTPPQRQDPLAALTERERAVVDCIAQHHSAPGKVLAHQLHMSESTLRNHLTSVYEKLGVANRHGLLSFLMRQHATPPAG